MLEQIECVSFVSAQLLSLLGIISREMKWWLAGNENANANATSVVSDGSTHDAEHNVIMLIKNDSHQTYLTMLSDFCTNGALVLLKGTMQMERQQHEKLGTQSILQWHTTVGFWTATKFFNVNDMS